MSKSLASGQNDYVDVFIRNRGDGSFHIQGKGPEINREYGLSDNIVVSDSTFAKWVECVPHKFSSLANTGRKYIAAQVAVRHSDLHFQIPGPKYNRPYGAVVDVPVTKNPNIKKFITAALAAPKTTKKEAAASDGCCQPKCCK